MSVNSSCKGCVFAEVDTHQTSCKLDRAAKLGIDDKDEDGFFVLSRFCTTYRPKEWLSDLSLAESMDTEKTVLEEIYPRVGFFIVLDTTRDDAIEQLRATVEDIKNQKEIAPRYIVIINDKVEYNEDAFAVVQPLFDFEETEYHILQLQVEIDDPVNTIDEAFAHAKNGYVYVTTSGERVPRDLIYKIHKRVNLDMKKLVVVKPYSGVNGLLFQSALFKFVNGNKPKLYQDEIIDNRPFLEKVKEAAKESDDQTLIDWSEFNES
jgi:hypothetical protein|tara:strand:- start:937 stop:1728 length:792 start_codon:yes stop_codon:yes gene_type:complete